MPRRIVLRRDNSSPEGGGDLTIDYRGELNEQQAAAATAKGGPVLIAAGTGKTGGLYGGFVRPGDGMDTDPRGP